MGGGGTGQGVGVALMNSGVTPVDGLQTPGKVVNGPDLSFESQVPSLEYLDTFGHGTHMAGIIAGKDNAVTSVSSSNSTHFLGMAPNAQIVSLKVADALGKTDVSQVLAAIDWVVQHQNDNGMNIRVLNLSYGTDSNQSYVLDPLAYAAEQAWLHGIVVVVAAGNEGNWSNGLDDPAIDPYVIAVGASNTENTMNVRYHLPASFTSEGDGTRNPDLSAPGTHIVSLRDPGSFVDDTYGSTAAVGNRFFLGSGTSQAAAVVSGAAALLLSQRPNLTPDQVKALLDTTTHQMYGRTDLKGSGELNLAAALNASTPSVTQTWPTSNGTGSLEASRGSVHVVDGNGNQLTGEQDIFGNTVDTAALAAAEANGHRMERRDLQRRVLVGRLMVRRVMVRARPGQAPPGPGLPGRAPRGPGLPGQAHRGPARPGRAHRGPARPGRARPGRAPAGPITTGARSATFVPRVPGIASPRRCPNCR